MEVADGIGLLVMPDGTEERLTAQEAAEAVRAVRACRARASADPRLPEAIAAAPWALEALVSPTGSAKVRLRFNGARCSVVAIADNRAPFCGRLPSPPEGAAPLPPGSAAELRRLCQERRGLDGRSVMPDGRCVAELLPCDGRGLLRVLREAGPAPEADVAVGSGDGDGWAQFSRDDGARREHATARLGSEEPWLSDRDGWRPVFCGTADLLLARPELASAVPSGRNRRGAASGVTVTVTAKGREGTRSLLQLSRDVEGTLGATPLKSDLPLGSWSVRSVRGPERRRLAALLARWARVATDQPMPGGGTLGERLPLDLRGLFDALSELEEAGLEPPAA